jgi:hypothetical protein
MTDVTVDQRSAYLAYQMLFPTRYPSDPADLASGQDPVFDRLSAFVATVWEGLPDEARRRLRVIRRDLSDPVAHNAPAVQRYLLHLLAEPMLAEIWSRARVGPLPDHDPPDEETQKAAIRVMLGEPAPDDPAAVRAWIAAMTPATTSAPGPAPTPTADREEKDNTVMSDNNSAVLDVEIDRRGLPDNFRAKRYLRAIKRLFDDRDVDTSLETAQAHAAYVTGALLRDGFFDPASPGFEDAFIRQWNEGYEIAETTETDPRRPSFFTSRDGLRLRKLDVYLQVYKELLVIKAQQTPTVQELAAVSDEVMERGPVDDNLLAKVRSAFDNVVSQAPSFDTLDLPPIITEENSPGVYEPENIRACSLIGAAWHLDRAGLFSAVDQSAQDWNDGVLPVAEGPGRLYDEYVWEADRRLDPAARHVQYQRIKELDDYLLRFCSAVSERERGLFLSEYLVGSQRDRRSPQPQDAAVRKTARDLLGYASLHGWAYTQFAAQRIANHIRECVEIIEHPEVQKAYGVTAPLQVVERVNAMSSGRTPDINKEFTLASTGKEIIDLLALKALDVAANRVSTPLFPTRDFSRNGIPRAVFSVSEYQLLLGHVENWLAANSITDYQRFDAAQPRQVQAVGSLPAPGGFSPPDANALRDQLMQMVGAGQIPSADQLNQMFQRPS